ncbi:hypothetical protein MGSAQ_000872, partial [marine sediment metagenome]
GVIGRFGFFETFQFFMGVTSESNVGINRLTRRSKP